jgi:DNA invertase Pin-like site-specific DNA recombinase
LVVWKLDRLARSIRQLIDTIERLEHRGVGFKSLTEAIDTTTSSGRLVFHIMAAMAEFERSIIRERTLAGLAAARERGRVGGRRRKLSDSDLIRARADRAAGATVPDLASRYGVGVSTLYKRL